MGNIYDFAGSYMVNKEFLAFGRPMLIMKFDDALRDKEKWDQSIELVNQEFKSKTHNLILNNCYDYTCRILNNYKDGNNWTRLSLYFNLMIKTTAFKYISIYLYYNNILEVLIGL